MTIPFTLTLAAPVFWLLVLTWLSYEGQIGRAERQRRARMGLPRKGGGLWVVLSLLAILASIIALGAAGWGRLAGLEEAFGYLGIVLLAAGVAVRAWAIASLGRFFSGDVRNVQQEQQVIQTGPYKLIRHPAYTGGILAVLGMAVAMASWLTLLVAVLALTAIYGYRIRVEEATLRTGLGAAYAEYARQTWRLIPFVY